MCYSNTGFLYQTGRNYRATLPEVFWGTSAQKGGPQLHKNRVPNGPLKLHIFGAEGAEHSEKIKAFKENWIF